MKNFWQELHLNKKPFIVFAPMDGVTDYVFREVIADIGRPDVFFTEFTNVDALFSNGYERTIPRLKYSENQRHIVAQIWGTKPENHFKAAKLIKELGFDGIDINMGCPAKDVMKAGLGACLVKNPTLAKELISATREGAMGLPVSVKTRLGVDSIVTEDWIGFLLKQKLNALTIHGRTAAELSKVPVHWDEVEKVVQMRNRISPSTLIIGNGDVKDIEEAKFIAEKYTLDGIMMGKAIFLDPWVFSTDIRNHTKKEKLALLLKHSRLYTQAYPHKNRFDVLKKFFKIYIKAFPGATNLKVQLMNTHTYDDVESVVKPLL